jgi:hypothetical protein
MKRKVDPKVLVVVDGGIAYVYAEPGVRIAIADLDNLQVEHDIADVAIHPDFSRLSNRVGIEFPTSEYARANDAEVIAD